MLWLCIPRVKSSLLGYITDPTFSQSSMEKIKLIRTPVKVRKREKERELMKMIAVNDEGMIVYQGKGPEAERTGSPAQFLIEWYLYKEGTKPLDFDIFVSQLKL